MGYDFGGDAIREVGPVRPEPWRHDGGTAVPIGLHVEIRQDIAFCGTWFSLEVGVPHEVEADGTPIYLIGDVFLKHARRPWQQLADILQLRRVGERDVGGRVVTEWTTDLPVRARAQVFVPDREMARWR